MLLDLSRFFGKSKNSKDVAKERLKLVLIHDRANVSPQLLETLRSEIMQVIIKYMDIDEGELDIQLTQAKSEDGKSDVPALYASIPIRNVRNSAVKDKRQA